MDGPLKSNNLVFAGPFLGEFGWELSHWAPHVRWLRKHYPSQWLIVASYPGRHPLYYGVANEFWPLPKWFLDEKYDVDCFEALAPENVYGRLLKHFQDRCESDGNFSNIIYTRTPRGFNHGLREFNRIVFGELIPNEKGAKACGKLIEETGNKPCIIIFARSVNRKMFLDIRRNQPTSIDMIPGGLPTRNWPRSHWEDLFDNLYDRYKNDVTFVIGGTKNGNCLLEKANKHNDVINLTDIDISESLDITIAFLRRALCSISSQSGPTHLSLQTKCPSFIYGHECERHAVVDNPFKTDVAFFETKMGLYNDPPELLFNDASAFIEDLLNDKRIKEQPKNIIDLPRKLFSEPVKPTEIKDFGTPETRIFTKKDIKEIKSIGMVGVFDVEGSTNIPFADSFEHNTLWKYNYRTELKNKGLEVRNREIIGIAKTSDLMIFCKGNGIDPEVYRECTKNAITCWFMMDAVSHLSNRDFFDYAQICDFSVVTTKAMKDALESAGIRKPIYHMIQPISPDEFYPVEAEKKYDVVFIGTKSEKRDKILDAIREWGYSVKTYGHGYGEYVTGEAFNKACCEARVCLAINNTDSVIDSFSDRILRYMATRSFVITEYSEGLEDYFDNHEDVVWFKTLDNLKFLLNCFIKVYKKTGDRISMNGCTKVLENHTWKNFAENILKLANEEIQDGR